MTLILSPFNSKKSMHITKRHQWIGIRNIGLYVRCLPESSRTSHVVHGSRASFYVAVVAGRIDAMALNSAKIDLYDCHTNRYQLQNCCCCLHCLDHQLCRLYQNSNSSLSMVYVNVSLLNSLDSLEDPIKCKKDKQKIWFNIDSGRICLCIL